VKFLSFNYLKSFLGNNADVFIFLVLCFELLFIVLLSWLAASLC